MHPELTLNRHHGQPVARVFSDVLPLRSEPGKALTRINGP